MSVQLEQCSAVSLDCSVQLKCSVRLECVH
uniref:Uncharacterized protein n=1 Tax=Anguilla anguilla TaxID=7936 RepID=A0A0E9VZ48_ANGAN